MDKLDKLPKLTRAFPGDIRRLERAADAPEDALPEYELSVSSEFPVRRWFGTEVLKHTNDAVDLTRFKDGAAVLVDHGGDQIGKVTSARLDDKRLVTTIVFSRSARGQEVRQDVEDGIRRNVSIGYIAQRAKLARSDENEGDEWHVTRWQPMELSIVSVPADPSVGFNRGADAAQFPVEVESEGRTNEVRSMDKTTQPEQGNGGTAPMVTGGAEVRSQAADIVRLCGEHGVAERAADFIAAGMTTEQVGMEILKIRAKTAVPVGASPAEKAMQQMPERDLSRFSYRKALHEALLAREGKGNLTGVEAEVHNELSRNLPHTYRPQGGVFVPLTTDPNGKRTWDSITAGKANELVYDRPGELIELLRPAAAVIRRGATVLNGLNGPVPFPKQTGGLTAYWVQENPAADVAASDPAFSTVTLSPKTMQAYTAYSRQLLAQSSVGIEAMVRNELAIAHGLGIDRAALHGNGVANEPLGIYKTPDVNTQAMGGVPTFGKLVDMIGKVADDNALMGNTGWLTTPLMAAKLMQTLVAAAAGSTMIWTGRIEEGVIAGYGASASNQVAKVMSTLEATGGSEHGIVFGNWSDFLIGFWGVMELTVDPYTLSRRGLIGVTSFQMADTVARHGESFCVSTGATLT